MAWPERLYRQTLLGEPFVQITLVDIKGSAPQILGAKAWVGKNGLIDGTVGGGKIEAKAILMAQALVGDSTASTQLVTWTLIRDVGMTCGGLVSLLFEVIRPSAWQVIVYGAGHVAQELVPLLCRLDCQVTCIDQRREWLDRLNDASNLIKTQTDDLASSVKTAPENAFFVLMTQGHATDLPILEKILSERTSPFVGVIGSHSKAAVLKADLRKLGVREERISQLHCPVGLEFGNNTPIEISLSIVAQLLQVRDGLFKGRVSSAVKKGTAAQSSEQEATP